MDWATHRSRLARYLYVGAVFMVTVVLMACASAVGNATQIVFTTKDIQAAIAKAPKTAAWLDGMLTVSLDGTPVVKIGDTPDRIGITARLAIQVAGGKPLPAQVNASAGIRYDESSKSFFLESPTVDGLDAAFIPNAAQGAVRSAMSKQLSRIFHATPVYTLSDSGPLKERVARRMLQSVHIRKDEVVATFVLH